MRAPAAHSDLEYTSALAALADRYDLVAVYAFGSRADEIAALVMGRDDAHESLWRTSDVDIGVLPRRGRWLSAMERVELMQALEALFGVARVDLVIASEVSTFLALDIVTGELLHAGDSVAEAEFQLYILRKAGDLAHGERERRRMIIEDGAR
jgi:predicted nucleotidyltransferase